MHHSSMRRLVKSVMSQGMASKNRINHYIVHRETSRDNSRCRKWWRMTEYWHLMLRDFLRGYWGDITKCACLPYVFHLFNNLHACSINEQRKQNLWKRCQTKVVNGLRCLSLKSGCHLHLVLILFVNSSMAT